jgi:pyrroline-5-carboxylate reductase
MSSAATATDAAAKDSATKDTTTKDTTTKDRAAMPRLGFIGWGAESAAFWETLQSGASVPGADTPGFFPGGQLPAETPLQPVPSVEALFDACDTILIELPPAQVRQVMPMIRLSIADRHMLVLLGQSPSVNSLLRQLNERKLVRCMVLPFRQGQPPLVAYFATPFVEPEELAAFRGLLAHIDHVLEVADETQFEVMQGLAAIAPAGFYTIMDALADGALMMGLPREQALRLIATLLSDTAQRLLEGGGHPALLREEALRSRGAAAGLMELESAGVRGLMMRTVERAMEQIRTASTPTPQEEE